MSSMRITPGPWGWYVEDNSMATLCGTLPNGNLDPLELHVMSVTPCRTCAERSAKDWTWGRCTVGKAADAALIAMSPELFVYVIARAENGCPSAKALIDKLAEHAACLSAPTRTDCERPKGPSPAG
jgi:hypothetical protein